MCAVLCLVIVRGRDSLPKERPAILVDIRHL